MFFWSLRKHGPLGTAWRVSKFMQNCLDGSPGWRRLLLWIHRVLCIVQHYLDATFDRRYGIDTAGLIPLKDLTIKSKDTESCVWYEPMSVKVFDQIMIHLSINFDDYEFIDFGSGKGRVILLASNYGFKKIIGVEFAQELHRIATENIAIYGQHTTNPSNVETVFMNAVEFPIPNVPVVIFFYSPFTGKVMEQVLNNVSVSFVMHPREIVLVFYGQNAETIKLLKATKFHCRELELRADWSHFTKYRGFLITSPKPK